MSWEEPGSPQLSLSGFSSLPSISSTAHPPARLPSLSLSIGNGSADGEDQQLGVSSDDGHKSIRAMKNRESALRSRARKRAYTQELEKEVRRLVEDNLKLKRQCKLLLSPSLQLQSEIAALTAQQASNKQSSPHRRTSSTQF
ncbi:bZIP transcription factor 27 isoform X1 [Triticum aestivum]|uniref:bZIP transcription factor 27 isoform X1 n=1 Tax=Triticum aestivum TaxID=4565 RepID=UPI001D0265BA|nr:bZIP transcription factor 27 isoform X1 [Triticum aestivum]